jgi:hypothetical protein
MARQRARDDADAAGSSGLMCGEEDLDDVLRLKLPG